MCREVVGGCRYSFLIRVKVVVCDKDKMFNHIVSKLVGYDLPYAWQLMHEIIIDDDFKFSTDIFIITNPNVRRIVEMILRIVDLKSAESLRDALLEDVLGENSNSEDLLGKTIDKLKGIFVQVTDMTADGYFDTDLIHQMLIGKAYTTGQLSDLVTFVCDSVTRSSGHDDCTADSWKRLLLTRLSAVQDTQKSIIPTFVLVLFKLISMLKEERVNAMNRSVKVFRRLFKNRKGLQYEREQVSKALESGELTLDLTYACVSRAIEATDLKGLVTVAAIEAVVGTFMAQFLMRHSLANDKTLLPSKVPEILMLDIERLSSIRHEIRLLGCSLTVWYICKAVLPYPIGDEFITEVLGILTRFSGIEDIDTRLRLRFECVPSTMASILTKSLSRDPVGLRGLFTGRIIDYATSRTGCEINKALAPVCDRVKLIRERVQVLCDHYDSVYAPLFDNIINGQ